MQIRPVEPRDETEWLRMRRTLYPEHDASELLGEMAEYFAEDARQIAFVAVAVRPEGGLGGFLEASLRRYAEGCDTSPVGYVESWYVDPDLRLGGVGALLVRAAEAWALSQGCTEMASDCLMENEISRLAHTALGYQETYRLIHFKKRLGHASR